jgi:hypothetical protein
VASAADVFEQQRLDEDAQLLAEWKQSEYFAAFKRRYDLYLIDRVQDVLHGSKEQFERNVGRWMGARDMLNFVDAVIDNARRR